MLIRELVIDFWCPASVARSLQEDLSMRGAVWRPPTFPAVVEMNYPSADQERRRNIDIAIDCL
jgi:hypothetical protein